MKKCQICAFEALDEQFTCPACGEATWGNSQNPEITSLIEEPATEEPATEEPATEEPTTEGAAPKRRGRPRKDSA